MTPTAGPAGTSVTIHGRDLPPGATILIGKRPVQTTAGGDHGLTFVVPAELKLGMHPIEIEASGKITTVGAFEVIAAPTPPPPVAGAPPVSGEEHHHHEWKIDRPVVSNYWPTKGKAGTKIKIHGQNFPADAMVMWAGAQIPGAKVTADEVVFEVPAGATSGLIALHTGHGRDLAVGDFEVAAYDADAEWKRSQAERQHAAEAAWADRSKQIAKDRAARDAAAKQWEDQMVANRETRRADRVAALRAKWEAAFLADPEVQGELTLHAQHVANLERMKELAEQADNGKLAVRIDLATTRENARHDQHMAALHTAFQPK